MQTVLVNSVWIHPGLLLRQFAQLAVMAGGERVTAGLGAGWSFEEFAAMGMEFPDFKGRIARFEDVLHIAYDLYHKREATLKGNYFSADKLPLVPSPEVAPKILVGGGGDRSLRLAAKYADKLDIIQSPKVKKVGSKPTTMAEQHNYGQGARGRTVVADLEERVDAVHTYLQEEGRDPESLKICVQVNYARLCRNAAEVEQADREICANWFHIPYQSLADNPYTLRGEAQQIAETIQQRTEELGLYQITIQENQDSVEFCNKVVPFSSPTTPNKGSQMSDVDTEFAPTAGLLEEEASLRLDALDEMHLLSDRLRHRARSVENELTVTVAVFLEDRLVYKAALPGTSADNDTVIAGKRKVAAIGGHSSLYERNRHLEVGTSFEEATGFSFPEYAPFGGAVPLQTVDGPVNGSGRRLRPHPGGGSQPGRGSDRCRSSDRNSNCRRHAARSGPSNSPADNAVNQARPTASADGARPAARRRVRPLRLGYKASAEQFGPS